MDKDDIIDSYEGFIIKFLLDIEEDNLNVSDTYDLALAILEGNNNIEWKHLKEQALSSKEEELN
jgi:hypothetical protein